MRATANFLVKVENPLIKLQHFLSTLRGFTTLPMCHVLANVLVISKGGEWEAITKRSVLGGRGV